MEIKKYFEQENKDRTISYILLAIIVIASIADVFWAIRGEGTISSVIRCFSRNHGAIWITFLWGVLVAHLFFTRNDIIHQALPNELVSIILILLFAIALAFLGYNNKEWMRSDLIQSIIFILGFLFGFVLWPQRFIAHRNT